MGFMGYAPKKMRNIELPELSFSPWKHWAERKEIQNSEYPGIYLISISKKDLLGQYPEYKDVVYIGMTNSKQGLRGRWNQFHNSISGKRGHSGGNTVFKELGYYQEWKESLYVSAMPIICNTVSPDENDLLKMGWVAYLEYEAFSQYYESENESNKPKYNKK